MKSLITLDRPVHHLETKNILSKNGYACALVSLDAGDELALKRAAPGDEGLVFVIAGEITVRSGEINTMLKKDEAHLLPLDRDCTIAASGGGPAKFLRVKVPARQVVDAPLYTLDSQRT